MAERDPGTPRPPGQHKSIGRATPKGRGVNPADRLRIAAILGAKDLRPDLLVEYLHRLQDAHGDLRHGVLAALAEALRLSLAEVFEVATFYHNFDVVPDEAPPAPTGAIRVCDGLPCAMAGAGALMAALGEAAPKDMRVTHAACLGRCDHAPVARIGEICVERATSESVLAAARSDRREAAFAPARLPAPGGGYPIFEALRSGARSAESVIAALETASLRGLGGAGFPTARKWQLVRSQPAPRLMAVNADESEPGTFKDRHYLLSDPHRFIEGMLIAAEVVGVDAIYIYLRDEYADIRRLLADCIAQAKARHDRLPKIELRRGAGAYICGEESAMLESLEGRRGLPRHKPPFPSEVGLFGRPTLINNVETLWWVPAIAQDGGAAFAAAGRRGRRGLRSFSVSGRVRQPGVKLAPAGISLTELIAEHCGGMAEGHRLKAYLPGGASGGILPASLADLPLDFGTLEEHGCFIGSAAIIVLSDQDDLRQAALNLMRFFKDESCGQCTPCRIGTEKALVLMTETRWDRERLGDLARVMTDASICGLGQAAPNGMMSLLRYFPEEV